MDECFVYQYLDDTPVIDVIDPEYEREVAEKIQQAHSSDEISDIISDALVKSLLDQLK